jgi:hypothetical protein
MRQMGEMREMRGMREIKKSMNYERLAISD